MTWTTVSSSTVMSLVSTMKTHRDWRKNIDFRKENGELSKTSEIIWIGMFYVGLEHFIYFITSLTEISGGDVHGWVNLNQQTLHWGHHFVAKLVIYPVYTKTFHELWVYKVQLTHWPIFIGLSTSLADPQPYHLN
jgi:hypothetical protein